MSEGKRFLPRSCKKIFPQRRKRSAQNVPKGSKHDIQDQIILTPEIMEKILEYLDVRNLKNVRLVCKSWLREAQSHMKNKGIVVLNESSGSSSGRVQKFIKMREKAMPAIPQPFQSIDLCVGQHGRIILKGLVTKIRNLDSALKITRFTQGGIPLTLAIPIVTQHSSNLEYLMLSLQNTNKAEAIPTLNSEESFPNLRYLNVGIENQDVAAGHVSGLVALVAGIVKTSPKLETYENSTVSSDASELASALLMAVDIRNVKTLKLSQDGLSSEALLHLMSIPFWQLQNLKIIFPTLGASPLNVLVLTTTLEKSGATLKTLNLSRYSAPENLADLPICPCVQELTLESFPYSNNVLSDRFPSLQVLNVVSVDVDVLEGSWTHLPSLSGLKTLQVKEGVRLSGGDDADEQVIRFLSKFPNLERVGLDYSFVLHCCELIATGDPQVANLLGSVKHLELAGTDDGGLDIRTDEDYYSPFAALTGIETVSLVQCNFNLRLFPLQEMPSLKTIRFPWGPLLDESHLENTRGLEKVVITNCCSLSRIEDLWTCVALDLFFDSAPNAECGCKDWKESSPEWS